MKILNKKVRKNWPKLALNQWFFKKILTKIDSFPLKWWDLDQIFDILRNFEAKTVKKLRKYEFMRCVHQGSKLLVRIVWIGQSRYSYSCNWKLFCDWLKQIIQTKDFWTISSHDKRCFQILHQLWKHLECVRMTSRCHIFPCFRWNFVISYLKNRLSSSSYLHYSID